MTLNITVLTPLTIYQSADFRLINQDTGKTITDRSHKTVSLQYERWSGFITYTGLGSWEGRPVSGWICNWLTGVTSPTMEEVADIVGREGAKLIEAVRRRTRRVRMRHTFTLAGFDGDEPRACVISNYQDAFGGQHPPSLSFSLSWRKLRASERSWVIITGQSDAVDGNHRRLLKRLAADYLRGRRATPQTHGRR